MILQLALGIVTAIGGFLDAGAIAASASAGALYGFQLIWAVIVGTFCVVLLTEMSGRLAAVSHHTVADAVRERLGFRYFAVPLTIEVLQDVLVLAAEIGGISIALHLAAGLDYRAFVPIVALFLWALLWFGNFSVIENGVSFLGLVALAYVAGPFIVGAPWKEAALGAVPSMPSQEPVQYWLLAVSIIGSVLEPFLLNFYSSGAVEEKWTVKDLGMNRAIALLGMSFGAAIAIGIIIMSALTLGPRGIHIDSYEQAVLTLVSPFGEWGLTLFIGTLGIACLGAASDVSLNIAYAVSQGFGWNWSENLKPHQDARFAAAYSLAIPAAAVVVLFFEPLRVTMLAMALNAVIAPLIVFPLLILMNDKSYLREYTNGPIANALITIVILLTCLVGLVALPLQMIGGGGG
jgi:Mn2+/Fe2+ NRAMP family transporter